MYLVIFDCYVSFKRCNAEGIANCLVVLGSLSFCISNSQGGNISFALQYLNSHFAGCVTEIIVADGKRCNAATLTDTFLAGNDRNLLGSANVINNAGVFCYGVVGRNVDNITIISCGRADLSQVIGIGEGERVAVSPFFSSSALTTST